MSRKPLTAIASLALLSLFAPREFALPQVGLRIEPKAWIPYGNPSSITHDGATVDLYSYGYGLGFSADLSLFGFLSPYLELGANAVVPTNVGANLAFTQAGAGASIYAYPLPRLYLRAGAGGGLAYVSYSGLSGPALYWDAKAELGFRFNPIFSVMADAGYTQVSGSQSAIFKGISAGLLFNIGLDKPGVANAQVTSIVSKQEAVFPIAYYKSAKAPIAMLRLVNDESAEIRDVRVSFSAGIYSELPADCGRIAQVPHGGSIDVPVYADFSDKVLGFTEPTNIQGEIKVDYKILGASRVSIKPITVVFNERNAATWADDRMIGAFVSPQDPVMLDLAKYLAGLVKGRSRPEVDRFLQYGMGIFEGLRVYGLVWAPDPNVSYKVARADPARLAYVQYPYQTLAYKSGDSDALAIAVAEALESVSVPAAIAALPGDVIVAFPLEMGEAQARTAFGPNSANFIYDSGRAWVPLRASLIRDGFLRAWQGGAELWKSQPGGLPPKLMRVEEAWQEYRPIVLSDVDFRPIKPSAEAVNLAFDTVLGRIVTALSGPGGDRLATAQRAGEGME
jgi:hypothetical protein